MTIDFEREANFGETVATRGTGRPNPLVAGLLVIVAIGALGYAGYVSYVKQTPKSDFASDEEFRTASSAPNLSFSVPSEPVANKLVIAPPPPVPEPAASPAVAPPVCPLMTARQGGLTKKPNACAAKPKRGGLPVCVRT